MGDLSGAPESFRLFGGHDLGGGRWIRKFKGENGSLGFIGPNLDDPLVVRNNPSNDGQAQTGAPFFGRKMGEKQFISVRGIDTHAVIREINFNSIGLVVQMSGDFNQSLLIIQGPLVA